jgi:diguanylate cyclase (GGDEF)-like protein
MHLEDQSSILGHIVSITESRDIEILEISMLRTIFELVPCRKVYFFKTVEDGLEILSGASYSQKGFNPSADVSIFKDDPDLMESMIVAFNDHRATSVDNYAHPFTICPVDVLSRNVGFIALDRPETTTQDLYILESLIRIYQNFVSVLIDNQRDTLTGLLNRKIFDDSIMKLIELRKKKISDDKIENERRSPAGSDRFWLGIFDIDNFKRINDTFGHVFGDEILILIGWLMKDVFRASDLKFRFGGEEFITVIRAESAESAYSIFERFRKSVENYRFPQIGTVTVSIGIVEITGDETTPVFVGQADKALYYAKSNGKNMTCLYSDLIEKGLIEAVQIRKGDVLIFDE